MKPATKQLKNSEADQANKTNPCQKTLKEALQSLYLSLSEIELDDRESALIQLMKAQNRLSLLAMQANRNDDTIPVDMIEHLSKLKKRMLEAAVTLDKHAVLHVIAYIHDLNQAVRTGLPVQNFHVGHEVVFIDHAEGFPSLLYYG